MRSMTLRDLIERKRDGGHIEAAEWHAFAHDLAELRRILGGGVG